MTRTLAVLACATVFALGLAAVRDHAALVRAGYEITALERARCALEMEAAEAREMVNRFGSPAALSKAARDLGLSTSYPRQYSVVRIAPVDRSGPALARND
jgi:hypothetical protein